MNRYLNYMLLNVTFCLVYRMETSLFYNTYALFTCLQKRGKTRSNDRYTIMIWQLIDLHACFLKTHGLVMPSKITKNYIHWNICVIFIN